MKLLSLLNPFNLTIRLSRFYKARKELPETKATHVETHSERTRRGLAEAATRGRFPGRPPRVSDDAIRTVLHLGTAEGSQAVGLSKTQFIARRRRIEEKDRARN